MKYQYQIALTGVIDSEDEATASALSRVLVTAQQAGFDIKTQRQEVTEENSSADPFSILDSFSGTQPAPASAGPDPLSTHPPTLHYTVALERLVKRYGGLAALAARIESPYKERVGKGVTRDAVRNWVNKTNVPTQPNISKIQELYCQTFLVRTALTTE